MGKTTFTIDGFEKAIKNLSGYGEVTDAAAERALKAGGEVVKRETLARVPIRTHNLEKSVKIGKVKGRSVEVGAMGKKGRHAHLVEYGHGGEKAAPPHPFLWPAYEASKGEAYEKIAEEVKRWMEDRAGK